MIEYFKKLLCFVLFVAENRQLRSSGGLNILKVGGALGEHLCVKQNAKQCLSVKQVFVTRNSTLIRTSFGGLSFISHVLCVCLMMLVFVLV